MKTNRKHGFTIVELVVVIAIIAVLAAVLIPTFTSIVKKANDSAYLQERTNQQIADLAEKVEKINYFTWEDFEKKLAEELAKVGSATPEDIQKAVDAAIAKYSDSSQTGNTGLTETQVKKIVEEAMKGQLTTAQVEAIVRQVLSGTTVSEETIRTIVNNAVKGMSTTGVTKAQVEQAIKAAISGTIAVNGEQLEAAVTNALKAFGVSTITDQEVEDIVSNLKNVITINEEAGFSTGSYAINENDANKVFYLVTDAALDSFTITGSTDETTIIIDAPNITNVTIDGNAKVLRVLRTADESTHIKGKVNSLEVNSGRVVIEAGATVGTIKAAPAKQATVTIVLENGSNVTNLNSEFQYYAGTNDYIKIIDNGATVGNSFITSSSAVTTSTTTNVELTGSAFVEDNKPTVENRSSVSADIKVNDTTYTSDGETSDLMLFAGGTGTDGDPYLIATAQHWNNMYVALADANSKLYFQLTNDVHFDDVQILFAKSWGYNSELDLNGNNHTVYAKNFEDDGYGYSVLFAYLYNSSIYDMNIDYLITSTGCSGLCYCAEGTCTFSNITTSGSIRASGWVASTFVMYPYPLTTEYTSTFIKYINCSNTCDISGSASYAAPFGGHCNTNKINVSFENCTNYGDISGQYASGFVGMVNGNYITFEGDNAALNYGTILGTSQAGNFTYGNPDKNGVYTTTFTANYNNANKTCTVAAGSSSIGKYQTFTINDPGFNNNIAFNTQSGATYYEVEFSTSVGNYGYGSVGEVWGGGFPRTVTLKYTNDDAVDGVITTDFKKLYIAEANNTKHHCLTNNEVEYNGLYVSENYVLSENDITFGTYGDLIVIAEHDGKEFYFINNNGYYGLLTSAEQADNNKTKTISIYVTAYTSEGGKLISSSTYSYTFKISDAVNYFGN